jgi:translation initiation factor IF-3
VAIQHLPRVNGKIRAREVRTIDADGGQLGVIALNEALRRAQQAGMDLVEIAPTAQPPVVRIMDFGKYRYEQSRRDREARKHHQATKVKELKFHANIGDHDYQIKLRHIKGFLEENIRVKVSLYFRGREMAHQEIGHALMRKLLEDCSDVGHAEMDPKLIGRGIHMMLAPRPLGKKQQKQSLAKELTSDSGGNAPAPQAGSGGFYNAPKIVVTNKQQG